MSQGIRGRLGRLLGGVSSRMAGGSGVDELARSLHPGAGLSPPTVPVNRMAVSRQRMRFFPRLSRIEDHPKAWRFPGYLDGSVAWVAMLRELYASPLAFPASLSPEMGLFLHALVRNVRPRTVVEVGTFLGASTIWMGSALVEAEGDPPHSPVGEDQRRGVIHCFDDFGPIVSGPWRAAELTDRPRIEVVREHLTRAGLADRAVLHPGDSSVEIVRAAAELRFGPGGSPPSVEAEASGFTRGVDLAFIDGDHTVAGAQQDLWAVEPMLNTGGYVVLHDIFPEQCSHDGPRYLLDHVMSVAAGLYEVCEVYTAPLNYGMAVLRRVG